jgi:hypothetical protein
VTTRRKQAKPKHHGMLTRAEQRELKNMRQDSINRLNNRARQRAYRARHEERGYPEKFTCVMKNETWDAVRSIARFPGWTDASTGLICRASIHWFDAALLSGEPSVIMSAADVVLLRSLASEAGRTDGETLGLAVRWLHKCIEQGQDVAA